MLLSNVLAALNLTDVCGRRGCHIGDGVIVASAVAVVVTYDLTNNILSLSTGKDTAAYARIFNCFINRQIRLMPYRHIIFFPPFSYLSNTFF